jgi:hypothetical protein
MDYPKKTILDDKELFAKAPNWSAIAKVSDQKAQLTQLYFLQIVKLLDQASIREGGGIRLPHSSFTDFDSALFCFSDMRSLELGAKAAADAGLKLDVYRKMDFITRIGCDLRALCLLGVYESIVADQMRDNPAASSMLADRLSRQLNEIMPSVHSLEKQFGNQSRRLASRCLKARFGESDDNATILNLFSAKQASPIKVKFRQTADAFKEPRRNWGAIEQASKRQTEFYNDWISCLYAIDMLMTYRAASGGDVRVPLIDWQDIILSVDDMRASLAATWGAALMPNLQRPRPADVDAAFHEARILGEPLLRLAESQAYHFCAIEGYDHDTKRTRSVSEIYGYLFADAVNGMRHISRSGIDAQMFTALAESKLGAMDWTETELAFRAGLSGVDLRAAPAARC